MNEVIKERINTYCEFVKRGKPTAMIAIQNRYVDDAIKIVTKIYNLNTYIENLSEGWKILWIYKDNYMLDIIKEMPEQPKTVYEHWVLGKIFGYSDESIKTFIETKVLHK
ncbi:hypothetical protein CLHOM_24490 [Clostridium homopropionicum DSM 5847]|uniref:Uncharacterized protein n=1 Tax=Clostridium homopropionicum DSM 5847 TaxID=1121318 RepID=A0A0L6Z984_9CLOT|nr:hypothetical protein [Clostridium homopropionicum]KOA19343.1 hypothetical protein CLHOM_24490 [Clostridium homopropionicum DSM 5847]SFG21829.1 hypothetical protein SAMN04488501_106209 [Clostridium homopropionicum]